MCFLHPKGPQTQLAPVGPISYDDDDDDDNYDDDEDDNNDEDDDDAIFIQVQPNIATFVQVSHTKKRSDLFT